MGQGLTTVPGGRGRWGRSVLACRAAWTRGGGFLGRGGSSGPGRVVRSRRTRRGGRLGRSRTRVGRGSTRPRGPAPEAGERDEAEQAPPRSWEGSGPDRDRRTAPARARRGRTTRRPRSDRESEGGGPRRTSARRSARDVPRTRIVEKSAQRVVRLALTTNRPVWRCGETRKCGAHTGRSRQIATPIRVRPPDPPPVSARDPTRASPRQASTTPLR